MNDTSPDQQPSPQASPMANTVPSSSAVVHKQGLQIIGLLALALVSASTFLGLMLYFSNHSFSPDSAKVDSGVINNVTAILSSDKVSGIYPQNQNETFDERFQAAMFQGLTQIDASGRAEGLLAKQWSNPTTSIWLFDLRPDAVFSNGQSVAASDVVFSINQSLKNSWPASENISSIAKVEATSNHQVKITTTGVDPLLLNELSQVFILDEQQYTTKKNDQYPIGSGAYVIGSFKTDPNGADQYVLKANPNYYLAKPKVQQVTVVVQAPDQSPVTYGIARDASVILLSSPTAEDKTALTKAGYSIKNMGATSVNYIGLDTVRAKTPYIHQEVNPLTKLAVRQALYEAIDTKTLAANPPEIGLQFADQMAPVSVFGSDPSIKGPTYNPTEAKQLLNQAGYPNGFTMTLDGPGFAQDQVDQVIKNWKDNLNVVVTYNPLDKDTGIVKLQNHDTSAYFLGWDFSTYDLASMSSLLNKDDPSNFTSYSNAAASPLVDKLSTTINLEQRKNLLQQLQKTVLADVGYIPLWFSPDLYAVKPDIQFPSTAPATWSAK